jgi:hypothetical protein
MADALRGNTIVTSLIIGSSATDADLAHLAAAMPLCCVDDIRLPRQWNNISNGHWDDDRAVSIEQLSELAFSNFVKRIAANDPRQTKISCDHWQRCSSGRQEKSPHHLAASEDHLRSIICALRTNTSVTAVQTPPHYQGKGFHWGVPPLPVSPVSPDIVALWDATAPFCAVQEFSFQAIPRLPTWETAIEQMANSSRTANRPRQRLYLSFLFARGFDCVESRRLVVSTSSYVHTRKLNEPDDRVSGADARPAVFRRLAGTSPHSPRSLRVGTRNTRILGARSDSD